MKCLYMFGFFIGLMIIVNSMHGMNKELNKDEQKMFTLIQQGKVDDLKKLLNNNKNININVKNSDDQTPLQLAQFGKEMWDHKIWYKNNEIVKILLENTELNVNEPFNNILPINQAITQRKKDENLDLIKLYVNHPKFNINAKDDTYGTPLQLAQFGKEMYDYNIWYQNNEIVKILLENKELNVNTPVNNILPINEAIAQSPFLTKKNVDLGLIKMYVNHPKFDINVKDNTYGTPLQLAQFGKMYIDQIWYQNNEIVKILLENKELNVNTPINDILPINAAIAQSPFLTKKDVDLDLIKAYVNHPKFDIKAQDNTYGTPLHLATKGYYSNAFNTHLYKNPKVARLLEDLDPETKRKNETNDMFELIVEGDANKFEEFLKQHPNIDINTRHLKYGKPLDLAQKGYISSDVKPNDEIVKLLLKNKNLEVNKFGLQSSATPLALAISNEKPELAKAFLEHPNINVNGISNIFDKTPLDLAWSKCVSKNKDYPAYCDIVKLLIAHKDIDTNTLSYKLAVAEENKNKEKANKVVNIFAQALFSI